MPWGCRGVPDAVWRGWRLAGVGCQSPGACRVPLRDAALVSFRAGIISRWYRVTLSPGVAGLAPRSGGMAGSWGRQLPVSTCSVYSGDFS